MNYTDSEGRSFELPKYTLKLSEAMSEAASDDGDLRSRTKKRFELIKNCLGVDYVAERCDGKTVDTVDVVALDLLFSEVKAAYELPASEAAIESATKQIEAVMPLMEIINAFDMQANGTRRGFKHVK